MLVLVLVLVLVQASSLAILLVVLVVLVLVLVVLHGAGAGAGAAAAAGTASAAAAAAAVVNSQFLVLFSSYACIVLAGSGGPDASAEPTQSQLLKPNVPTLSLQARGSQPSF